MAKVLAARLGNAEFENWVDSELNGFENHTAIPAYRVVPVNVKGNLSDGWRQWNGAPVMTSFLPDNLKGWGEEWRLTQPISELASAVAKATTGYELQVPWPQEIAVSFGAKSYNGFECLGAWQVINSHAFVSIIDTVRNRILDFVLKIERENPAAGEADPNSEPVPAEKLQPLVHNVFCGPVGNVAQNSQRSNQTANFGVPVGDLTRLVNELAAHIGELNLDPQQTQRAQVQIAALAAELAGDPNPTMVQQAGRSLRNMTEGAIGSLIATAAQPGVWHWIHQMLVNFK